MSAEVPGAVFPAFYNKAFLPIPSAYVVTASTGLSNINKNTIFTWSGSPSDNSVMEINVEGRNNSSNFPYQFRCVAQDSGSFSFPAAVRAVMSDVNFGPNATAYVNFYRVSRVQYA
jgi:hypothetical protein